MCVSTHTRRHVCSPQEVKVKDHQPNGRTRWPKSKTGRVAPPTVAKVELLLGGGVEGGGIGEGLQSIQLLLKNLCEAIPTYVRYQNSLPPFNNT